MVRACRPIWQPGQYGELSIAVGSCVRQPRANCPPTGSFTWPLSGVMVWGCWRRAGACCRWRDHPGSRGGRVGGAVGARGPRSRPAAGPSQAGGEGSGGAAVRRAGAVCGPAGARMPRRPWPARCRTGQPAAAAHGRGDPGGCPLVERDRGRTPCAGRRACQAPARPAAHTTTNMRTPPSNRSRTAAWP
jgi:hypothetical protein